GPVHRSTASSASRPSSISSAGISKRHLTDTGARYRPRGGGRRLAMGILREDVDRVRAASDFVQIAGEHIALKKVGQRYVGLCPFHAEKTPSFSVNGAEGLYYCLAGETGVITWEGIRPIR